MSDLNINNSRIYTGIALSLLIAIGTVLAIAPANAANSASVKNFFAPNIEGTRVDSCLTVKESCGKPAADAFCVAEGYSEALLFQREAAPATRQIDSGMVCEGMNCVSFKQIKCAGPAGKGDLAQKG